MRSARTLPLRCAPIAGEALDSWIEAVGAQLRMPVGELLAALGLHGEFEPPRHWTPWMTLLHPQQADRIAVITGVAPDVLHTMTLQHFDQRALVVDRDRHRVNGSAIWGRNTSSGSRFCPDCLRENGGRWSLEWRLGWSFACLTHRRLLVDFCPSCGSRQRHRTHPTRVIPIPGRCGYLGRPGTDGSSRLHCLHPLAESDSMVFDQGHPVLLAQHDLLETIARGTAAFGVYAHDPQPALAVLADMKAIARRVLFHMPAPRMARLVPEELVRAHFHAREHNNALTGTRRRAPLDPARVAPAYAATVAAGVTAAWSILGQAGCRQAALRMRELLDAIVDRGYWTSPTVTRNWGSRTSPLLEAVHLKTVAPTMWPNAALRYRTALPNPSSPTTGATGVTARAHKTPGVIWPLWAARLNPVPQVRENLPAALSASLLLVDSRIELVEAVKKLGGFIDQPVVTHVLQALRDDAHYEGIQLALIRLAAYLDSHEVPIDYARRRRLDYTALLTSDEWTDLCRRTLTEPGAGPRHRIARCYLFERISGLPHTQAPHAPANSPSFRNAWRRFPYVLTQAAARELDKVGRTFLDRRHLTDEPLTWQPPRELLAGLALPRADPDALDLDDLHRRVQAGESSSRIADALGTDPRTLRYVLGQHPSQAPARATRKSRQRGQDSGRGRRHRGQSGGRGRAALHLARRTICKEQLADLYVQQEMTFLAIERQTGIDRKILATLADEYGIARHTHRPRGTLDRQWLHEQYVVQRRTLADLGREAGMSGPAVAHRAREYGIPTNTNRQPRCPQYDFTSAPQVIRPTLGNSYALRRLRVFIQVVRHPTLTEACHTHGIHPSTLTAQLKRLETDLGGPLLIRAGRGRRLELTDLGREVVLAVEEWAQTLAGQPRETWDRSAVRRPPPGRKRRTAQTRQADAPGLYRFPALLHPAVRTFDGRRRLLRFLEAAHYPTLAAYCRDAGRSPSAMTAQIQQLERDLQGQLLIRGQRGHRMRVTEFGEKVLAAAGPYADHLRTENGPGHVEQDRSP